MLTFDVVGCDCFCDWRYFDWLWDQAGRASGTGLNRLQRLDVAPNFCAPILTRSREKYDSNLKYSCGLGVCSEMIIDRVSKYAASALWLQVHGARNLLNGRFEETRRCTETAAKGANASAAGGAEHPDSGSPDRWSGARIGSI